MNFSNIRFGNRPNETELFHCWMFLLVRFVKNAALVILWLNYELGPDHSRLRQFIIISKLFDGVKMTET